jgi:hypothetical protein
MLAGAAGGAALARTSATLAIAIAGAAAFVLAAAALIRRPK